ncbi:hypothetical protein J1605_019537 [Eschrichtius robustus]|uniref:Kinesin motor domain-containing protein n=1 Tax=Eschrichtius robustus TaxID=9764 RepID=A0AB34HM93_ESCRO|nr:hypothetical protein J1605_019537 [Eschrichtius robustus]
MREVEPKDQPLTGSVLLRQVALRTRPLSDAEREEGVSVIAHKAGTGWGCVTGRGARPRGGAVRRPLRALVRERGRGRERERARAGPGGEREPRQGGRGGRRFSRCCSGRCGWRCSSLSPQRPGRLLMGVWAAVQAGPEGFGIGWALMVALMDPGEDPEDTLHTHRSREKTFIFDIVFDLHTSQHLVEGVISGYNATVFAHGPSGASKTHTMLRMDAGPGIYLQMLTDLFQAVEETRESTDCSVSMSCLEIYNEVIWDLLNPSSGFLDLREDSRGSIQIAGITEVSTSNTQELRTTQLLTKGNWQRTQESTATSKMSSRSHAVLQVTVHQRSHGTDMTEEVHIGRLSMMDLAGLELAPQTQNRGKRMKEGAPINRSLLALGNCINALSEKGDSQAQYVNFWDANSRVPAEGGNPGSHHPQLAPSTEQDALGGNSRMVMIAHISPASTHFEESRTTLLYAYRARNIKRRVKRNLLNVSCHIAQYADIISDLGRQIKHPKAKVEKQEKEKRSIPAAGMLKVGPYTHPVPPAAGPSGTPEAHCVLLPLLERCLH